MLDLKKRFAANWQALVIFAIFLTTFITFNILFDAASQENYFKEILAALIGTILAAVVTTMLLKSQTRGEELKEQNVEVFRSKLHAYDQFISQAVDGLNDEKLGPDEVRELKKLAYQISLISSNSTVETVTGFIRSNFLSKDEQYRMPSLVNAFRLDLALQGVEALDSGDLDIIETALRDPGAFNSDTAEKRLDTVRAGITNFADGRFDLDELSTSVGNIEGGRGFQIQFFNGMAINVDAEFSNNAKAPVEAYIFLGDLPAAKRKKASQQATQLNFVTCEPDSGPDFEATIKLGSKRTGPRKPGELSTREFSDAIASLSSI